MSVARRSAAGPSPRWPPLVLVFALVAATLAPLAATDAVLATADHLVVSEVVTGGASASDELIAKNNQTVKASTALIEANAAAVGRSG